ncbi:hypothetical protein HELRODRAFT_165195 [Helobdella robusta]|uniref:HTH CENPB-type domain-containing protein n=1 Tax=Helobdella robusta TaxID=6412 RepID=T1EWF0_HELRO|nr:hypothetical protein HELRODRAFT_165195 [Helobdella robusta]ESN93039.1 hypothetical protein HELRODRAFT_165195 [Helobdella robusta]
MRNFNKKYFFCCILLFTIFAAHTIWKYQQTNVVYLSQDDRDYPKLDTWSYTTESKEFSRYINSEIPKTNGDLDAAFEVINDDTILPPSARIRARKLFTNKSLVIWATEWHMTPIKDVENLLTPFGVKVINYNLDPYRCEFQRKACEARKNLKVLNPSNVLDALPKVVDKYIETYRNDAEMNSVDVVYCGYPASLCEVYVQLNKSVLVLATTRYDVGRYTAERWRKLNDNFRILAKKPWNIFGGNNLYDARFIQYYTGIKTHHIPSMCDYTGAEYTNTKTTFLILRRRDRGFNNIFYKKFEDACHLINCSAKIKLLGNYDYSNLAKHRGVVHVPYQISVMSIFEQYRMNIPMFFPSPKLLTRWQVDHYIMPERFGFIMVRYRERKTNRGKTPVEVMRTAVDEVLKKNRAINAVARETGIDRMTLKRYVRKSSLSPSVGLIPNWNTRQVFNLEQEEMLAKYLLQASKMNYGLSTKTTRQFAYDMAVANNITCPSSWSMKKTAGIDWLQGFMKRRPELSLRAPEATSLARATAFNKYNRTLFVKFQIQFSMVGLLESFDGAFFRKRPTSSIIGPDPSQGDVPDPKNEFDYNSTRYWMQFADFYQVMPYGVLYESIPHLVQILKDITDEQLMTISSNMRRYNVEFKKKLLRKWRKILLAFAENSPNRPH